MPSKNNDIPDRFPSEPDLTDKILTLDPEQETEMPADLSPSVAAHLLTETIGNIQANNRDGRNAGTVAINVLTGAMARRFDELGVLHSRAVSGVLQTPIASPTKQ